MTENQRQRVARAFREAGADAVDGYRRVLIGMMNPEDRPRFEPKDGGNGRR